MSAPDTGRVHLDVDRDQHVARLTIDRPERKNAYDPPMRERMREYLHEVADDDDVKVLILRGTDGVFSTGADMANAYAWYGGNKSQEKSERRPSQRRRLAVDRVSFEIRRGETLALVGESGSGKSVTALSIMKLLPYPAAHHPSGQVLFKGRDLLPLPESEIRHVRGNDITIIFQEPMTSLNPLHTIEKQLAEILLLHGGVTGEKARKRIKRQYPVLPERRPAADFGGDFTFWFPSVKLAERHSRFAPTWFYRFDAAPRTARLLGLDATHGLELFALFEKLDTPVGAALTLLGGRRMFVAAGRRMQAHWVALAGSGAPEARTGRGGRHLGAVGIGNAGNGDERRSALPGTADGQRAGQRSGEGGDDEALAALGQCRDLVVGPVGEAGGERRIEADGGIAQGAEGEGRRGQCGKSEGSGRNGGRAHNGPVLFARLGHAKPANSRRRQYCRVARFERRAPWWAARVGVVAVVVSSHAFFTP